MNKYSRDNHPAIERINRLRQEMMNEGIDWLIISTGDPHLSEGLSECDKAREYYSGFTGSAGTLVVNECDAYLWTDSRYYLQAGEELAYGCIVLMKDGEEGVPSVNEFIAEHVWPGQIIGLDYRTISQKKCSELKELCEEFAEVVNAAKLISICWENKPERTFRTVSVVSDELAGQTVVDKIENVRKNVGKQYIRGDKSYSYIISDLCSVMWLTNLRGSDISHVPVAYSYLVIDQNVATLYIKKDSVEPATIGKLNDNNVIVRDYSRFEKSLSEIASDMILVDPSTTNSMIFELLKDFSIIECNDYKLIKKYIKNDAELKGMIDAHIIDAKAMISYIFKVKKDAKEGIATDEFESGKYLDELRLYHDECEDLSFDTICAFKENAAIVHYKAPKDGSKKIINDGLLLVDSGAHYSNGTTDITRTIVLGNISEKAKRCYTAVLKGNLALMSAVFARGIRGDNLDILARKPIWEEGYDYGHGTGHGIGCKLSVHEPYVTISYRSNLGIPLEEGMVVSDEPGIYLEGEFGIRLENALRVIKKDEKMLTFDSLTMVPFDREAIIPDMLTDTERVVLNSYHKRVYDTMHDKLNEAEREWLFKACQEI